MAAVDLLISNKKVDRNKQNRFCKRQFRRKKEKRKEEKQTKQTKLKNNMALSLCSKTVGDKNCGCMNRQGGKKWRTNLPVDADHRNGGKQ